MRCRRCWLLSSTSTGLRSISCLDVKSLSLSTTDRRPPIDIRAAIHAGTWLWECGAPNLFLGCANEGSGADMQVRSGVEQRNKNSASVPEGPISEPQYRMRIELEIAALKPGGIECMVGGFVFSRVAGSFRWWVVL